MGRPKPVGQGGFQLGNVWKHAKMCKMLEQCPTQLDEKPRVSLREACGPESFSLWLSWPRDYAKLVTVCYSNYSVVFLPISCDQSFLRVDPCAATSTRMHLSLFWALCVCVRQGFHFWVALLPIQFHQWIWKEWTLPASISQSGAILCMNWFLICMLFTASLWGSDVSWHFIPAITIFTLWACAWSVPPLTLFRCLHHPTFVTAHSFCLFPQICLPDSQGDFAGPQASCKILTFFCSSAKKNDKSAFLNKGLYWTQRRLFMVLWHQAFVPSQRAVFNRKGVFPPKR